MKFIEMFAGIGGIGYGLEQAGMECVAFAEFDKFAHNAYQLLHNKNNTKIAFTDVTNVTNKDLLELKNKEGVIDVLSAGFPCQSFSLAGNRRGFDDTRGTLFFDVARWASILKPNYLLLENVKGLLSHDKGRTFSIILQTLDELGYDAEWQVLNSKNFGVPQNRERVFIVGHLRDATTRKVFPIRATTEATSETRLVTKRNNSFIFRDSCTCIDANYSKGLDNKGQRTAVVEYLKVKESTKVGYKEAFIGDSVNLKYLNQNNMRGRVGSGIANTVLATAGQGVVTEDYRIRNLTPLECFRLQSFPDSWYYELVEAGISNKQLYKMAGNAVTSNVAKEIGLRMVNND